jgi:hypothetical protein
MQAKSSGSGGELDQGRELVLAFVEFTSKVLQNDMRDFFNDNAEIFDQDEDDLARRGETMEQYDVFKKYEQILGNKIEGFCSSRGYTSSRDCFNAIQDAISLDKNTQNKLMKELQQRFAQMRASMNLIEDDDAKGSGAGAKSRLGAQDDAKADAKGHASKSKSSDDDKKSSGGESKGAGSKQSGQDHKSGDTASVSAPVHMPFAMFFPPMPLDRMLDNILRLTEYTTFSSIMRNKVKQLKFIKKLEMKVRGQEEDVEERGQLLQKVSVT